MLETIHIHISFHHLNVDEAGGRAVKGDDPTLDCLSRFAVHRLSLLAKDI